MTNFDEIKKVLTDQSLELPDLMNADLDTNLSDIGFDSMTRADMYITLGEHYETELLEVDENELNTFNKIISFINNTTENK